MKAWAGILLSYLTESLLVLQPRILVSTTGQGRDLACVGSLLVSTTASHIGIARNVQGLHLDCVGVC
jgi:hypothetical protein